MLRTLDELRCPDAVGMKSFPQEKNLQQVHRASSLVIIVGIHERRYLLYLSRRTLYQEKHVYLETHQQLCAIE